jgi:hypothetical protein
MYPLMMSMISPLMISPLILGGAAVYRCDNSYV